MAQKKIQPTTIDEYISQYPEDVQRILAKIRATIKKAAPKAAEKISYAMPAFYLNGDLVWFGVRKDYIGFYPKASGIEGFKKELSVYTQTKGAVHFPFDKPMPYALISKIVKYRLAENLKT